MAFAYGPPKLARFQQTPPRVDKTRTVASASAGDFVMLSSNNWTIYLDTGSSNKCGGLVLGSDTGYINSGMVGTPGIDLNADGVFRGDGAAGTTSTYPQVLVLTPELEIEIDLYNTASYASYVAGALGGIIGATQTMSFAIDADSTSTLDGQAVLVEVIKAPTDTVKGRGIIRFIKLDPGV